MDIKQAKIEGEIRKIHNESVLTDPDMKEAIEEADYFTGEIWLSTDGKHTIHIAADTRAGRTAGGKWAIEVYKWIVKELGTKPELWEEVIAKKNGKEKEEEKKECSHPTFKLVQVKKEGPNKGKFFKKCETCGEFIGWAKIT